MTWVKEANRRRDQFRHNAALQGQCPLRSVTRSGQAALLRRSNPVQAINSFARDASYDWPSLFPHGIIDLVLNNIPEYFMNVTRLLLAISMLAAGTAVANSQPSGTWDSLVGMKYAKARKEVIDAGWRPDHRNASAEWERQLQGQFPELRSCEAASGQCTHYFVSYDGICLKVVTEGETVAAFKVRSVQQGCPKQQ